MNRRNFLISAGAAAAVPVIAMHHAQVMGLSETVPITAMQTRWRDFLAPGSNIALSLDPISKDLSVWRGKLPGDAFSILFKEDTERAFSSALNDEKRPGLFVCRACNLPLFSSEMKYDSRTGWPSFFTAITDHYGTKTDFGLIWPRTEYHCAKCGGHQGHIFDDGPQPTGQRFCNNGLALRFIPLNS